MNDFHDRARARDAALKLRGMLTEVRNAPKDARDFLVFDKRDDWAGLGVSDDDVEGADLSDDALLDHHIAQAGAAARALGHVEDEEVQPYEVAQIGPVVPAPRGAGQRFLDAYDTARRSTVLGSSIAAGQTFGSGVQEKEAVRQQQQDAQARRDALEQVDPPENANGGILGQALAKTAKVGGIFLGKLSSPDGAVSPGGELLDIFKQAYIDGALKYAEQPGGGPPARQKDYGAVERWGLRGYQK